MIQIRKYGKYFNKLMYGDTCTVKRHTEVIDPITGMNITNEMPITVYENITCKFSFEEADSPKDTEVARNPIRRKEVVYLDLDYDIIEGDIIEGERIDEVSGISQKIYGICNEPNRYNTHQQVEIYKEGDA